MKYHEKHNTVCKLSVFCILFLFLCSDWHDLRKVKVGMPVSHDQHSYEMVNWKVRNISLLTMTAVFKKGFESQGWGVGEHFAQQGRKVFSLLAVNAT